MLRNLFKREPSEQEKAEERQQLEDAVEKTREGTFGRISDLFRQQIITDDTWDELEDLLIQADVGPVTALTLVERARKQVERDELKTPVEAETAVRSQMVDILGQEEREALETVPDGTTVLSAGVNGSGKTTSI